MTEAEIQEVMSKPENANRARIDVRADGDEYVAEWGGKEYRAGNPFGLDSLLTDAGAPQPRNLFFVEATS